MQPTLSSSLPASSSLSRAHYFGIFTLALATLAYQVLITRIFSVVLYYHFAFAGVSLAMFGLTRGAMMVYRQKERFSTENIRREFAEQALLFGLTSAGMVVLFLSVPLIPLGASMLTLLSLMLFLFIIPFSHSGVCIALLLTRLPKFTSKLYAADLCGAAIGCLGIVGVLFVMGPVSAVLWISLLCILAGRALCPTEEKKLRRRTGIWSVIMLIAAMSHTVMEYEGAPPVNVSWAKGKLQVATLFERWNAISRIRVSGFPGTTSEPFGWGFTRPPTQKVQQLWMDIDAEAGTVLTQYDGEPSHYAYLRNDIINAAYLVRHPESVAVIGVGGGRDILSALHFGVKSITGIELNPTIFYVLTERFAEFIGHMTTLPGVTLRSGEARSTINQLAEKYGLIQISLIDTWAATAAGGLTLSENQLYTVEAWQDFYRALAPGGMLSVSRWYHPLTHSSEFYRLIGISAQALMHQGVPADEITKHLIALRSDRIVTVITSPTAFTPEETDKATRNLLDQGFEVMIAPGKEFTVLSSKILSGTADDAFYNSMKERIDPTTDDHPFFFYSKRMISSHMDTLDYQGDVINNLAVQIILGLLLITLMGYYYYVIQPLSRLPAEERATGLALPLSYFTLIGVSFMFIEMSQMQRLMVYLGHPLFGLSVVLFSLLLFSGIGSMTLKPASPTRKDLLVRGICLLGALTLVGIVTPMVAEWGRAWATMPRILVSILLLAPPAFFMGMMFPLGLSVCRDRQTSLLPFFWGTNGIASVFASVLGVAISMEFTISITYRTGMVGYALCVLILLRMAKRAEAEALDRKANLAA